MLPLPWVLLCTKFAPALGANLLPFKPSFTAKQVLVVAMHRVQVLCSLPGDPVLWVTTGCKAIPLHKLGGC